MWVHNHNGYWVDTNNKRFYKTPFNENGPIDVAQINHYFCKTEEEFKNIMLNLDKKTPNKKERTYDELLRDRENIVIDHKTSEEIRDLELKLSDISSSLNEQTFYITKLS